MRIYEDRNNRRDITCGYCHNEGNNKRNCPTMKAHWLANPHVHETYGNGVVLTGIDKTMFPVHYQNFWCDDDARRQFRSHWRYMRNRFSDKPKATKKRKKSKCGFCGSTAHNRRNCNKLKNFVYVLKETNKAYRAAFYDKFVEGMGLGAGALLSVQSGTGESVGIITSFPTEQIMFTNLLYRWNDYHTKAHAKINVQGNEVISNLGQDCFYGDIYKEGFIDSVGIWRSMYSNWGRIHGVVSPAPNRPTKEWFMGQTPCFEWVVKKRDQATLMSALHRLIKHFYPHDNLRAKLGAKIYDQYYTR